MVRITFGLLLMLTMSACGQAPAPSNPPAASAAVPKDKPEQPADSAANPPPAKIEKLTAEHLPNPVRITEKVISGGLPEGDKAFAQLKELGIKTVISVDGAKPDVATAEKFGMRYIHLPHGYDGVPENRAKELAKAVRDLPGPIYIHCHHGKHRSPAAAAVACAAANLISHEDALSVLKIAGTSEAYRGLFQSVEETHPLDKALLDELQPEFPATAKIAAMAEAMIEIEHIHDRLKAMEKSEWKAPANQPSLVADHEALLLREQFTEMLRTKDVQSRPEKFQELVKEAETFSLALEEALKAGATPAEASKLLVAVNNNCKSCHTSFRDIPLSEKKE